jgi:hypothetical protein
MIDWEMWARIAASGIWGYVPEFGAVYRIHQEAATVRLKSSGQHLRDLYVGSGLVRSYFPPDLAEKSETEFFHRFGQMVMEDATEFYVNRMLPRTLEILCAYRKVLWNEGYARRWMSLWLRTIIKSYIGKLKA